MTSRIPTAKLTGVRGAIVRRMSIRMLGSVPAPHPGRPCPAARGRRHVPDRGHHRDLTGLLAVLAPDVVLIADGGGLARAVRKPLAGRITRIYVVRNPHKLGGLERVADLRR